ncbi:TcdA/TcdB pore-forming domain-containing protein [Pseudomonas fluorescens]|uniref:TcdA/TcdB pore-forming domain-containing protein n=1 Tax=Pseudomonas fluorescens TaxID=294 RepID=UPI000F49E36D|nr:TcdA/TcdB pore-forming domain-containing protein [Pseudomonas fluorescens]RON81834.1 toxin [Pseudomonas fluorescens]
MRDQRLQVVSGYVGFISLFKQADLEQALLVHRDSDIYQSVWRYYFACIGLLDSPRLIEPLTLLKHSLEQLIGVPRVRRDTHSQAEPPKDALSRIYSSIQAFETRLRNSETYAKTAATEVVKNLHFVWLGGGLGAIQHDYLNLWKQVLSGQGYSLHLWYDSDALLAWQTNKLIVEAAKADAMQHGGSENMTEARLGTLYEERVIVLKQQMFLHINAALERGLSADEARVDLLSRAYGQDAAQLETLIEQNRRSLLALAGGDLQLRDLRDLDAPLRLQGVYDRETRLRGNLAAASDVVRVEAVYDEGGRYVDVDNLPPLVKTMGGIDISTFGGDARLGVLQLLLDHNPHWMPGRRALRDRYADYLDRIPEEHRAALEVFARQQPALNEVFQAPAELLVRPQDLRAVAVQNTLSNSFLMAHAQSPMLKSVIERFRFNYEAVEQTSRLAAKRGVALSDFDGMTGLAREVLEQTFGPLAELSMTEDVAANFLMLAIAGYFSDGIRPQSEGTIYLTGPAAMRDGMADYERHNFVPREEETLRVEAAIDPLWMVNDKTEEEQDHSWKDNASDAEQWVLDEQQRWREGQYSARYSGDVTALLTQQNIVFEEGWPVIEGRPVLLTDVLQRMIDRLGEPFVAAMREGHNGPLRFPDGPGLGFDDRQAIKAQPVSLKAPASLNDASVHGLALDELLSGIAQEPLRLFQASALQRVLLGQLLGVRSLDNQSFKQVAAELDNLANSVAEVGASVRYAAIERHLYQHRAAQFMAGLASHVDQPMVSSDSALTLKRAALSQAHTLFQWGRHVALIQTIATREHREQVILRLGQVLGQIEASDVKLVPQDLLLQGPGDPGGRCYPLALIMSAALEHGVAASRRLRERFFLATAEPQQRDSMVFLEALEELRGVQLHDIGKPLGRVDLQQLGTTLEAFAGSRTLMLNSDNHAMLVAKIFKDGHATYHFYDPNFGVFEFSQPEQFQLALTDLFQKQGLAKYYAAYGDDARPTFDLIELQGQKIAALDLSGGLRVGQLLESDNVLPEQAQRPIRRRLNSARGHSLVSNPHLGRSLRDLDSHWWGQQIAQATDALQHLHASAKPLVPLFETLEITPAGEYRINLIDPLQAEHVVQVVSTDHRLLRIRNYLSEQFSALGTRAAPQPIEAGAVHTLNTGFTIQALMNVLRGREGDDRTLTTAVRLHAYVNYAQLVHGNVTDVAGLISLIKTALNEEKIIARTCAPVVGEALGHIANEGVGAVLGLANAGFDIYQLATADNEIERAQFGTQLAFDSASLALTAGGLGAATAGAATAAAVLGGAGVILGGLAIGVAALAQGFARISGQADEVGRFFDDLERACRGVGYRYDDGLGAWVAHPSLVVQSLDFTRARMVLDSPKVYRLRDHFGVPDFNPDDQQALDLRRELGLPGYIHFDPPTTQLVVLPCTPTTYYGYEYKALPFSSLLHHTGFDTARKLEKKDADGRLRFLFSFYSFPVHYIINRLAPSYRPTVIEVRLDARERALAVPMTPAVWHDKVSYRIEGAGGACSLILNRGVNVQLQSPSLQQCRWNLVATWATERDVRIDVGGVLSVAGVKVTFDGRGRHEVMIQLTGRQSFKVNRREGRLDIVEQDAPAGENEQSLLTHYQMLAREHRLVLPYTPVHHFLIPFELEGQPRHTTAWYDAAENRFLYIRSEEVLAADEMLLAAVVGDSAFFYEVHNYDIWQIDAVSGLLKCRYRLLVMEGQCSVRRIDVDAQGVIHIEQQWQGANQQITQFNYLLHEGQLQLVAVTREIDRELGQRVFANPTLTDWTAVLGHYFTLSPVPERAGVSTVDWQPAAYVSVCWAFDPGKRDLVWIRSRDLLCIHPFAFGHTRGWADSIKHLGDLLLLPVNDEHELFFIYDRLAQKLCKVQRSASADSERWPAQWTHQWLQPDGLNDVVPVQDGYLALTDDGLFFNLSAEGEVHLGGSSERWLKGRAQWWQALETLAAEYPVDSFAILGLRNATGERSLCGWYVDDRVLLCDPGHEREMRLLGVTPDNQAAWLFDVASGEICSQRFFDSRQLEPAFGSGAQLLASELLPAPQAEWDDWRFSAVRNDGSGLCGTSVNGVSLKLRYQEAERIIGVDHHWASEHAEHLPESLQALLETAEHEPYIAVESGAGNLQWFDVANAQLIRVAGQNLPHDCELLGTRHRHVLLHELQAHRVHVYPDQQSIGPFEYVRRDAEVLVVEGQNKVEDLLPLIADDVSCLVLRLGQGGVTYHLSRACWLRLDSVIVDCRHPLGEVPAIPGNLVWALDAPQTLQLSFVDEHLLIVDPDRQHSLILRDVCSADPAMRGDVFLGFEGGRSYAVSSLVQRLREIVEADDADGSATLAQLLGAVPA